MPTPTDGRLGVREALARYELQYFPHFDGRAKVVGRNDRRNIRVEFTSGSTVVDVCGLQARLPLTAELYHDALYVPFRTLEVVSNALVRGLEPLGYLLSVYDLSWTWADGRATGETRDRGVSITVRDGSTKAIVNGELVTLARPVREQNGHLRAPHDLFDAVARVAKPRSLAARPGAAFSWETALWGALAEVAGFGAGAGDSLTFGGTILLRKVVCRVSGGPDVGYGGGAYVTGQVAELVVELAIVAGPRLLLNAAKKEVPRAGRMITRAEAVRRQGNAVRDAKVAGLAEELDGPFVAIQHHLQPLLGHPGIPGYLPAPKTLFPTGALPSAIANGKLNTVLIVVRVDPALAASEGIKLAEAAAKAAARAQHMAMHRALVDMERAAQKVANERNVMVRLVVNVGADTALGQR